MITHIEKSEPTGESLTAKLNNLKGFEVQNDKVVIRVSNLTIYCAALKIILPMLITPGVLIFVLAITKTILWSAFYFIGGIILFTFICATFALLFNRQYSYYKVSLNGITRSITGMTREADYSNIKQIKPRRSLVFKNGGSIRFKLYRGSGINLQFFLLNGFSETSELISACWLNYNSQKKLDGEFEKLFPNSDFDILLDFVGNDSAHIDELPDCYKVYYIMWMLYDANAEAGFDEFFINNREISSTQLLEACELLNFPELLDLCKRAVALIDKYGFANCDDLPEECDGELSALNEAFLDIDSDYGLENIFKQYFIDNFEKFDFKS